MLDGHAGAQRVSYSRKGQAIVETALLLPILMLLVMGSADLGRGLLLRDRRDQLGRARARAAGDLLRPHLRRATPTTSYAQVLAAAQHRGCRAIVTLSPPH